MRRTRSEPRNHDGASRSRDGGSATRRHRARRGTRPPYVGPAGGKMSEISRVVSAELKAIVEAPIFASPDPPTPEMLYRVLAHEPKEEVKATLEGLQADY